MIVFFQVAFPGIFKPLALLVVLHDLPLNYAQIISLYDGEGNVSAKCHVGRFEDFVDLEEVDHEDIKMRMFAWSLSREAKKWYKYFPPRSILNFVGFQTAFLERWDDKKIPLQLLSHYNNLKKGGFESVHEFSSRFMRAYNSIPANIKPSPRTAKLHYVDAFDNDFVLLLRERKSATLLAMFTYALEVEANMMACEKIKLRAKVNRRKGREEIHPNSSTSSSSDVKLEMMLKTMEQLMYRLMVEANPINRE